MEKARAHLFAETYPHKSLAAKITLLLPVPYLLDFLAQTGGQRIDIAVDHQVGPEIPGCQLQHLVYPLTRQPPGVMGVGNRAVEIAVAEDEVSRQELGTNVLVDHLRVPGYIEQELGNIRHAQKAGVPGQVTNRLGYFRTKHALVPGMVYGNSAIDEILRDAVGQGRLSAAIDTLKVDKDGLHCPRRVLVGTS